MKKFWILSAIIFLGIPGCAQKESSSHPQNEIKAGGPCEGCEAVYECPVPFKALSELTWLPDWNEHSPRKIAINGIVYQADGKTPVEYVWAR